MGSIQGWHRAVFLLAALAIAGCGGLPPLREPPTPAAPISVRVQLSMVNVRGETYDLVLGSGFLVNADGHVVTAGHMIENARNYLPIKPSAHFTVVLPPQRSESEPRDARTLDASLVLEDPSLDLAVLQIDAGEIARPRRTRWLGPRIGISEREVPRLRLDAPPAGAAIVLAGYPEGEAPLVQSQGSLVDDRILDLYEIFANRQHPLLAALREKSIYLVDVATQLGQSGSPVFLADTREVIGVCISVLQLTSDPDMGGPQTPLSGDRSVTIVVQARALAKLLDAHEIPWHAAF